MRELFIVLLFNFFNSILLLYIVYLIFIYKYYLYIFLFCINMLIGSLFIILLSINNYSNIEILKNETMLVANDEDSLLLNII